MTIDGSDPADVAAVIAADQQRCVAIRERDHAALSAVLTDDLAYRHSSGLVEGKVEYIKTSIEGVPTAIERPRPVDVRIIGDVALVSGDYDVRIGPTDTLPDGLHIEAEGLQVWLRQDGQWRLLAHHGGAKH